MKNKLELYKAMLKIRLFEEKVSDFVENRQALTPCHLYIGQEAIAVGVCSVLEKSDSIWGNHRSHGHFLAKGGDIDDLMAEILCRETGTSEGRGGSMHLISMEQGIMGTVPIVAATIPLAVGTALAYKIRKENRVTVAFFGDGATEEGNFHESINLAALYKLPIIFICENNYYASHLNILERRVENNLREIGDLYRINSVKEDGNDLDKVIDTAKKAVDRARRGEGPSFLEYTTYRWRGHVGHRWDMDVGVKRKDELNDWIEKDPILRFKKQLILQGTTEKVLESAELEIKEEIEKSVEFALNSPFPHGVKTADHVFVDRKGVL